MDIKKRLEAIDNEVKGLHPVLENILRKLPAVENVHYTHGPNEMGADFILEKRDETLRRVETVGLIVKVGKISLSHPDVEKQIKECLIERMHPSLKTRCYFDEIWIVANGTISKNAQDKIFEEHKKSKIKFVDLNTLTTLANNDASIFMDDITVQESVCLREINTTCAARDNKHSLLAKLGHDIYIDQKVVKLERSDATKKTKVIDFLVEVTRNNSSLLEGPMGGGKSKLVNKMIMSLTKPEGYELYKVIPYFMTAKQFLDRIKLEKLADIAKEFHEQNDLENDQRRKILFVVDGLDEIFDKNENADFFQAAISEVNSSDNLKILLTSRSKTDGLFHRVEKYCDGIYRIEPFGMNSVLNLLNQVCKSVSDSGRMVEDLKKSPLFKSLPKTPITAILLARVISQGQVEEIPSTLTDLYAQYSELAMGRWDTDRGLRSIKEYEVTLSIVTRMAKYFMENHLPEISYGEAKGFFENYLSERNFGLNTDTLFDAVLERSDILIYDVSNNTISFKHRSFLEYFYALAMSNDNNAVIDTRAFKGYWHNSFFFYVGIKKECPEILDELISMDAPGEEGFRISKIACLGRFLLAGYKTPYAVIEKGIKEIFSEAAHYYIDVIEAKDSELFGGWSQFEFLAAIRYLLQDGYSFQFFQKAISNIIEDTITNPQIGQSDFEAFRLFFLDVAREESGGEIVFENLEEIFGSSLPLILQISLAKGDSSFTYKSTALRRMEKRVKKMVQNSLPLQNSVKELFQVSINGELLPQLPDQSHGGKKRKRKK